MNTKKLVLRNNNINYQEEIYECVRFLFELLSEGQLLGLNVRRTKKYFEIHIQLSNFKVSTQRMNKFLKAKIEKNIFCVMPLSYYQMPRDEYKKILYMYDALFVSEFLYMKDKIFFLLKEDDILIISMLKFIQDTNLAIKEKFSKLDIKEIIDKQINLKDDLNKKMLRVSSYIFIDDYLKSFSEGIQLLIMLNDFYIGHMNIMTQLRINMDLLEIFNELYDIRYEKLIGSNKEKKY